jgi:hypothetical protein
MKADNPNPQAGSKEWVQQAVPAQQVARAGQKIARKERQQGVAEAETDYSKRRQRERDIDAGKPVARQRPSKMTDYQKRRAQDKKDMALGESDQVKKVIKDKAGRPVGEVGIDSEASPGNGPWYVKHYATRYNVVGFDSAKEALKELMYVHHNPEMVEDTDAFTNAGLNDIAGVQGTDNPLSPIGSGLGEQDAWHSGTSDQWHGSTSESIDDIIDVDAGRPVKALPKNPQTDYARKRAQEKRDLERFGEGNDLNEVSSYLAQEPKPLNYQQRIKRLVTQYQTKPAILGRLAQEKGADSDEQIAFDYMRTKQLRPEPVKGSANVNWNDVVRGITTQPTLQGQDLLNAAATELKKMGYGTTPETRDLMNSVLNGTPEMHRQLQAAYDKKVAKTREMAESGKSAKEKFAQASYDREKKRKEFQQSIAHLPWEERMRLMRGEIEKNLNNKDVTETLMKPPTNRKEYLDQRDKLFRMLALDANPVNKQIIKQALKDLDAQYGKIKDPVREESSTSSDAVERAILNRIMVAHTDLLMQFGPDKVMQAAEEVAYNVGDVDEIGTSDVSAYVNQVRQILGVEA